jgi:hypothetical protein
LNCFQLFAYSKFVFEQGTIDTTDPIAKMQTNLLETDCSPRHKLRICRTVQKALLFYYFWPSLVYSRAGEEDCCPHLTIRFGKHINLNDFICSAQNGGMEWEEPEGWEESAGQRQVFETKRCELSRTIESNVKLN